MANFEEQTSMTRHQYWYDANSNCWYVRHQDCTKFMKSTGRNQDRPVCDKCLTVGDSHSIVRSAQRFAVKHLAAELLSLRLFGGAEAVKEVMEKAQGLQVYKTNKLMIQQVCDKTAAKLQQWVRGAWMTDHKPSAPVQRFLDTVVRPSLQCNVANIPEKLSEVAATFHAIVSSGQASDSEMMNLQMASAAMSGQLESHPLLIGLCLQTSRMLEKRSRGITKMSGRRSVESEQATELIKDAGVQLAFATGNSRLAQEFGLSSASGHFCLDQMEKHSLPSAALALCFPSDLENNFVIADQRYPRRPSAEQRASAHFWDGWLHDAIKCGGLIRCFTRRWGTGSPLRYT